MDESTYLARAKTAQAVPTNEDQLSELVNVITICRSMIENLSNTDGSRGTFIVNSYKTQFDDWVLKRSSVGFTSFWNETHGRLRALEALFLTAQQPEENIPEDLKPPRVLLSKIHGSWNDYSSSEEETFNYLLQHVQTNATMPGLALPADLETVWPFGYRVFSEVSRRYNLEIFHDPLTTAKAGMKGIGALSDDKDIAKAAFSKLNPNLQRSINVLKSIVAFLKMRPDETLASDSRFALSAKYVLHFCLKSGNAEKDNAVARSMEFPDGGRKSITGYLKELFTANDSIVDILMNTIDKVCRAIARSTKAEDRELPEDLKLLIIKACYTSPEGMCENYYVHKRKLKTVPVEGKKGKTEKKWFNGFRAPSMHVGDELLKPSEKIRFRDLETQLRVPKMARNAVHAFLNNRGDLTEVTNVVKTVVTDCYAVTDIVHETIKSRKHKIRIRATEIAGSPKILPAHWIAAQEEIMERTSDIPLTVDQEVRNLLEKYGL